MASGTSGKKVFFDQYSVLHGLVGAAFAAAGVPIVPAFVSHLVWEAVENRMKGSRKLQRIFPETQPDAWQNQAGDLVSFSGGYLLGSSARKR